MMSRANFPEQMGYANGGDVDPEDFLAKADTLSTADRTRIIDGEPYTTPVDSVYTVTGKSRKRNLARRMADSRMRHELARSQAGLAPGEPGSVSETIRRSNLAILKDEEDPNLGFSADPRSGPDPDSGMYEYTRHFSPDMWRRLLAATMGTEGRASGGLIDGYAGGGIYTMPHFAQMAGGGIYTIPMAGGGMYVPGYGLGGFFRGLSKVASVASMIPGPHQAFTVPIAAGSGAIGGAMDGGGLKGALRGGAEGFIGAKAGQSLGGAGGAASAASKGATAASGLSTLDKIMNVAQHPAMMSLGYPLLGEALSGVGADSLGRMGAPVSSRGGEEIQRVMPSYVTDRQGGGAQAQGYAQIPSRRRGGMMEEGGEMGIPDFMPQPVRPRRPIPEYTAPVIRRRPDLNIDRPVRPDPASPPPPSRERREETSEIEDRFERVERRAAPREDRRGRRERPEDQRERGPREGGGDLSGTEERTTRGAEPEGRGTSYEEGRYRYGDRMTEEQKRMAERFETQDEFGDADESAEIENIRAIARGTPSDDIVSINGTMIEGESPYDDSPTSMPGYENPELLAQRDRDLGAAPVVVGSSTGQFTPQAYEITDIPEWYRAGLMSEQALETGQPETFLGQDPFSVFAGQQQDPISMFRGPAAPQAPLQMPNMPFLQQGQPQMGPPPPMIADPGDKFSRPRIEAPRRAVPAEQQMQPPMQMPQPVQPSPDFMPQPMQQMPVSRMLPPPRALEGRADGGMAPQDIPFEGFIEPFEDGTMESSGAVDDRVAVMKPNLSEVGPEQMEMLSALKNALRNPNSEVSRQIIELARNTFGEEFIINLMDDMLSAGNNTIVEDQDDRDRLVEMEFRGNLAEGGPVRVGAAIAPNEYVLTASQVRNVGGGSTEEGAKRIKKLARDIDIAGSKTDRPLNVEIA